MPEEFIHYRGAQLDEMLRADLHHIAAWSREWLTIRRAGPDPADVTAAYREVLSGHTPPEAGYVLNLG